MTDSTQIAQQEALAHHSWEIERLSEELIAQQTEISRLTQQVARLQETVKSFSPLRTESDEEAPPHY